MSEMKHALRHYAEAAEGAKEKRVTENISATRCVFLALGTGEAVRAPFALASWPCFKAFACEHVL